MLVFIGVSFLIGLVGGISEEFDPELYGGLFILITLWPMLSVHTKRWHDRGRSGWWLLVGVIPIGVLWILFECAFLRGNLGENRFGTDAGRTLGAIGKADQLYPVLIAILICLAMATTIFPRYRIPSGAMMPTLLVGDFIIVSKFAYGLPVPFTNRELMSLSNPVQGDVIVFRYPLDESIQYIQRVVGASGDRIAYSEKKLYINGERLRQSDVGVYAGEGSGARETGALLKSERVGDVQYSVLIRSGSPDFALGCNEMEGYEITIPDDHYFVMGDNRDNSNDSRCWGFVPRKNIVGKVLAVWMTWDSARQDFPVDYSRMGKLVR